MEDGLYLSAKLSCFASGVLPWRQLSRAEGVEEGGREKVVGWSTIRQLGGRRGQHDRLPWKQPHRYHLLKEFSGQGEPKLPIFEEQKAF